MKRDRDIWIRRIKRVENHYLVACLAAETLRESWVRDSQVLTARSLSLSNFHTWQEDLVTTYLVRIFAEFESGLRECWPRLRGKQTIPKTEDLINGIASRRYIPNDSMMMFTW